MNTDSSANLSQRQTGEDTARVEKTTEDVRQGTSRQGVIFVLAVSLLLAIVAAVALSIGYDFNS